MNDDELSWEQKNRLYGFSMIPSLLIAFASAIYFLFYLKENNLTESILDVVIYVGLPIFLIGLPLSSLAFEVLYQRKIKQPLVLHFKRYSSRLFFVFMTYLSFYSFVVIVDATLSIIIGEEGAFILGTLIYLLGFSITLFKFREFFSKLDSGKW
jgi:hypothetical protein